MLGCDTRGSWPGGTVHVSASNVDYTITAFFFGGPDAHETLAYGALMVEHPGIKMKAVRFHVDPKVTGGAVKVDVGGGEDGDAEARFGDEDFIADFKDKVSKDGSIKFEDVVVKDATEALEVNKAHKSCNLFLVGRISEGELAAALKQKSECPEPATDPAQAKPPLQRRLGRHQTQLPWSPSEEYYSRPVFLG